MGLQTTSISVEPNSPHVNVSFKQAKQTERDECFIGTNVFPPPSIPSPRRGWKLRTWLATGSRDSDGVS